MLQVPSLSLRRTLLLALSLCTGSAIEAIAETRFPISSAAVASALNAQGLAVTPGQVHLATAVTSATASPVLQVFGAERSADGNVRLRMRCAAISDCLAFVANLEVTASQSEAALGLAPVSGRRDAVPQAASTHPAFPLAASRNPNPSKSAALQNPSQVTAAGHSRAQDPASAQPPSGPTLLQPGADTMQSPAAEVRKPAGIHAGARVTLSLRQGHLRIRIPAVAIDSGAPQSEIRVATPDHKTTFRALVLDAENAEGILP